MVTRIFNTAGFNRPSHLLEKLPEERAIRLLGGAHPDRRAEIFRSLSGEAQGRLFDQLNEDAKTSLSRILKYPADQAGSIMTTEFVSVPASWMVKQVIDHIRSPCAQTEQIYAVYQVDPQSQRLLQAVSLRELLIAIRSGVAAEKADNGHTQHRPR
jgi:magnesium transporter